ncbi:MAG TPA: sugar ABC transporter permease [Candidatus Xenobia bacterium]|jgi:ABC-type maltose transport system permease subunit
MKQEAWRPILSHVFLLLALAATLFPAAWVLGASMKEGQTLDTAHMFPEHWTLSHYHELFTQTLFNTWMANTLYLCVVTCTATLVIASFAGYAFSRFKFIGKTYGLLTMLLLQVFPSSMAMVATFKLLLVVGRLTGGWIGLNTLNGLALVYTGANIPFNTWMIKGYVDSLPKELEESALLDGATPTQTFLRVILPLMTPILAVVALFSFILPYADFLFPSILMTGQEKFTLAVGLHSFISGNFEANWTQFAAASMVGAIPILCLFFGLQRFLVEGLTKGAVKG